MAFHKIKSQDPILNRAQDVIGKDIDRLIKGLFYKTAIVTVALGTTEKEVFHNLGYAPVGYLVVKRTTAGVVTDTAAPDQTKAINLTATIAGTYKLVFF